MPYSLESLGYIKCYGSSSPRPVKNPNNSIRCNCQKICIWLRRPKTILEIRKKATFLLVISNSICKFLKDFTNHRKKTNRVVVFSSRPFPTSVYTGTTNRPSNNLENKTPSDTYWRVELVCKKGQANSSLEPLVEYNQDQMPLTNQGLLWPF